MKMETVNNLLNRGHCAINMHYATKWLRSGLLTELEKTNPEPVANTAGISLITITGPLISNPSAIEKMFFELAAYGDIQEDIEKAVADTNTNTIVYAIDSPGGMVTQLNETVQLIKESGENKRTIAFTDGYMTSAAFALAMGAQEVYAIPSARVANIGTIYTRYNFRRMYEQNGVTIDEFASGPDKTAVSSEFSDLTPEQKAFQQAEIDAMAEEFRTLVRLSRPGVPEEYLTGWDYSGADAARVNLIDGTFVNYKEFINYISQQ